MSFGMHPKIAVAAVSFDLPARKVGAALREERHVDAGGEPIVASSPAWSLIESQTRGTRLPEGVFAST